MRQSAITCKAPAAVRRTRQREVRDPYDELRPWSAITHGAGAVLSAVGTALLLRLAILRGSGLLVTVFLIYGLSMTGLYTASTLYHCVNTSVAGRRALRKYDHCSIYLLIAGSYTPVCMVALRQSSGPALLAAVWFGALDTPLYYLNNIVWELLGKGTGYIDKIAYSIYYAGLGTVV
mgnify:CR=1 FL=1